MVVPLIQNENMKIEIMIVVALYHPKIPNI